MHASLLILARTAAVVGICFASCALLARASLESADDTVVRLAPTGKDVPGCGGAPPLPPCRTLAYALGEPVRSRAARLNGTSIVTVQAASGHYPNSTNAVVSTAVRIVADTAAGSGRPTFDGQQLGTILRVQPSVPSVELHDLVLLNGAAPTASGAFGGGALRLELGLPTVGPPTAPVHFKASGCTFSGSRGPYGGGVSITVAGNLTGGSQLSPDVSFEDCAFEGNDAVSLGGGMIVQFEQLDTMARVEVTGVRMQWTRCTWRGNNARAGGGGVTIWGSGTAGTVDPFGISDGVRVMDCAFEFDGCTWSGNSAAGLGGGGVFLFGAGLAWTQSSQLFIKNSVLLDNIATGIEGAGGGALVNMFGGELSGGASLVVSNCTLRNNTAVAGAAIGCTIDNNSVLHNASIVVEDLTVTQNRAGTAPTENGGFSGSFIGGALDFILGDAAPKATQNPNWCNDHPAEQPESRLFEYNNTVVSVVRSKVVNNTADCDACLGGGLSITNAQAVVSGSLIEGNFATAGGGGVYVGGVSGSLLLLNSTIAGNKLPIGQASATGGQVFFQSYGSFVIGENVEVKLSGRPQELRADGASSPVFNHSVVSDTVLSCEDGATLSVASTQWFSDDRNTFGNFQSGCPYVQWSTFLSCTPCPRGSYLLSAGEAVCGVNGSIIAASSPDCHPCPFGGDCSEGGARVKPLIGYYGVHVDDVAAVAVASQNGSSRPAVLRDALSFYACPAGYCATSCGSVACCAGNRTGVLCGACKDGFQMSFGSLDCVETSAACYAALWVVPVAVCFVGWLVLLRFSAFEAHAAQVRRSATQQSALQRSREACWPSQASAATLNELLAGLAVVMIHYYQSLKLLLPRTGDSEAHSISRQVGHAIVESLNGDASALALLPTGAVCMWPDTNGVTKAAFSGFFLPAVALGWTGVFALWFNPKRQAFRRAWAQGCSCTRVGAREAEMHSTGGPPALIPPQSVESGGVEVRADPSTSNSDGNQDAGLWVAILLGKALFSCVWNTATFRMLHCVAVPGLGSRLFIAADSECYEPWQYVLVVALVGLLVFPVWLLSVGCRPRPRSEGAASALLRAQLLRVYAPTRLWWEGALVAQRSLLGLVAGALEGGGASTKFALFALTVVGLSARLIARPFRHTLVGAQDAVLELALVVVAAAGLAEQVLADGNALSGGSVSRFDPGTSNALELLRILASYAPLVWTVALYIALQRRRSALPVKSRAGAPRGDAGEPLLDPHGSGERIE